MVKGLFILALFLVAVTVVSCGDKYNAVTDALGTVFSDATATTVQGQLDRGTRVLATKKDGRMCAIEWEGGQGWLVCTSLNLDEGAKLTRVEPAPLVTPLLGRFSDGTIKGSTGTLLNTSGSGEDVSDTFRLTEPCGKFVISWTAKQTQEGQPFMNFRVYDTSIIEYAVESYGTISFSGEDSGRSGFPLDAGTYYLQIQGYKASWTVKVTCEG